MVYIYYNYWSCDIRTRVCTHCMTLNPLRRLYRRPERETVPLQNYIGEICRFAYMKSLTNYCNGALQSVQNAGWLDVQGTSENLSLMWLLYLINKSKKKVSRNRPWKLIELWDVKDPTLSRQSAHRWRQSCQPYAPAVLCSPEKLLFFNVSGTYFC
jgi:hypothetical protein